MHLFRPKIYDVELYKDSSVIFEEELIYHVYTNNSLKDFFRWKREEFKGIIKKNSFKIELAQSTNFFLSPICRIEGQFLKSKGRLTIGLKIELKIIFAMLILAFTVFMIFLFCNMDILYLIGRIEIITAIIFLISIL